MDSLFSKASSFLGSQADEDEAGDNKPKSTSSAGYGDMLSKASSFLSSQSEDATAPADGHSAPKHSNSSGGTGDIMGSAQVLFRAAKERGQNASPDMGEVAGATAELVGAAAHYTNVEKTPYGGYAVKAQSYLHDYQASHAGKQTDSKEGHPSTHSTVPGSGLEVGGEQEKPYE